MIERPLKPDPEELGPDTPGSAASRWTGSGRKTVTRWVLVACVLLAFGLRTYDLGAREFWFDEALTANVSALGWQGIVAHLGSAPFEHPPLYFLTLYPWQQLAGTSEFAFRFVSVLWGVLFVPLFYVLVKRWAHPPLALLGTLLAVVSPFLVAYSQEARMYTMIPCLAVLTLLAFGTALERERQPGWWLVYLGLLLAGTATHYAFSLIGLATALYLGLDQARGGRPRPWALAGHGLLLLAGLVWLMAAPGLRTALTEVLQGQVDLGLGYKLGKTMPALILGDVSAGEVPLVAHLIATGGWLLALLGVWAAHRGSMLAPRGRRLLLLMLVVSLVA